MMSQVSNRLDLWETPKKDPVYMIAGWRQWADAGSISSGLPHYLIQLTDAHQIGEILPDGFYLFQFPGTHDLVRPVVRFDQGYPKSLEIQQNQFFYNEDNNRGLVIFLGDEPHLDVEGYVQTFLEAARALGVRRITGLGGVYGELPYDKERMISSIYSLPELKEELKELAVNLSDYQGGASISSYICKRAGEQGIEYASFYAFVPTYDFSHIAKFSSSIRLENDFTAWLGVMKRINYWLKLHLNLDDLEKKSTELIQTIESKIDELERKSPQSGIKDYLNSLSEDYNEVPFSPLEDVWEEELRRLFDRLDEEDK